MDRANVAGVLRLAQPFPEQASEDFQFDTRAGLAQDDNYFLFVCGTVETVPLIRTPRELPSRALPQKIFGGDRDSSRHKKRVAQNDNLEGPGLYSDSCKVFTCSSRAREYWRSASRSD